MQIKLQVEQPQLYFGEIVGYTAVFYGYDCNSENQLYASVWGSMHFANAPGYILNFYRPVGVRAMTRADTYAHAMGALRTAVFGYLKNIPAEEVASVMLQYRRRSLPHWSHSVWNFTHIDMSPQCDYGGGSAD